MALSGSGVQGTIKVDRITIADGGDYTVRLLYTRNGLEDKKITLTVNGEAATASASMRSWNWVDVPVHLRTGANRIAVSYSGTQPLFLDSITILRGELVQ